ncbi:23S rRNA (uracil(1939)-C(5))-methyltransferase RlmD [Metamycoplasma equirhinis]|uniref:23S rRNA (uracil(1939)-C(5))-methyltransferase RlmD n=2 Tax=Metamycoplasma equirhinis TaxID=92402 RepID=UPI00359448A7
MTLLQSGAAPLCVLSYENQLKLKQNITEKLFKRNLPNIKINEIKTSPKKYEYRNKITLHVSKINDELKFGFYKKYSHDLIVQSTLPLAHKEIEDVYLNFVKIANTNKISKLLTDANLSEITFRHSNFSNETQLILSCQKLPKFSNEQINQIQKLTNIDSLVLCIADKHKKSYKTIFGNEYIKYAINNLKFKVSNDSFYQVNEEQTKHMYEYVSSLISKNNLNIIDAFSGVGTIGLFLAKKAKNITCIEINKFASQCAFNNAIINNINNVSFVNLDVIEYLVNKAQISDDVIVFDPPRSGLDRKVIESITTAKINKIIYISCNPGTLVRDLLIFKEKGYSINSIQPFDMFPQTFHIVVGELKKKFGKNIFRKLNEHSKKLQAKQEEIIKKHNSLSAQYDELEYLKNNMNEYLGRGK